jgi:hypothetical protein
LSSAVNMFILVIWYDLCLLPAFWLSLYSPMVDLVEDTAASVSCVLCVCCHSHIMFTLLHYSSFQASSQYDIKGVVWKTVV